MKTGGPRWRDSRFWVYTRHGRSLTGDSPKHTQVVESVYGTARMSIMRWKLKVNPWHDRQGLNNAGNCGGGGKSDEVQQLLTVSVSFPYEGYFLGNRHERKKPRKALDIRITKESRNFVF